MSPLLKYRKKRGAELSEALRLASTPHAHGIFSASTLAILDDGRVITGCDIGEIRIWQFVESQPQLSPPPPPPPPDINLHFAESQAGPRPPRPNRASIFDEPRPRPPPRADELAAVTPRSTASGRLKGRLCIEDVVLAHSWSVKKLRCIGASNFVSSSLDGRLIVWRPDPEGRRNFTEHAIFYLPYRAHLTSAVLIAPGLLAAVFTNRPRAYLWRIPEQPAGVRALQPLAMWQAHEGFCGCICPVDNQYFATGGGPRHTLKLWTAAEEPQNVISVTCSAGPVQLAVLPADERLLRRRRQAPQRGSGGTDDHDALHAARLLAVGLHSGVVELYTLPGLVCVGTLGGGTNGWIASLAASPDGRFLVVGCDSAMLQVWRRPRATEPPAMQLLAAWPSAAYCDLGISADARTAFSIGEAGCLAAWDLQVGGERRRKI